MDVAFGDFTLTEREALFEEASHSIEFIWQDGIDDKVYDTDKSSSRSRKLVKQRAVPVGTANAVQFSEKCLRQEGGGVKVDGEIIFQAPVAPTDSSTTTDVSASESKEDDRLAEELVAHESLSNEETSSLLNVAAPEFVPESTPAEIKDDDEEEEEEENIAISNSSDVSSSQGGQSHKHRHFNKHQAYPYHVIPDYMVRGPPFPPLHLPYAPYLIPRHPREPLIPLNMPFGYPYPPMHLQQSRMFPDGFPARHPQIYAAGIPSEIYMMDYMGPFPQDAQNRHYPWGSIPEQAGQSPEPNHEAHDGSQDDGDGTQEVTSPNSNASDTTEPRSHDNVTSLEDGGNQYPVASSSDNTSQFATVIEHNDPQLLDDTSSNNISNKTEVFSEEVHQIKDNSTGQVVDNGYIHKDIDSSHKDKSPPSVGSKASLELDSSSKSDLESSSEKAEVTELSQDTPPADNTVQYEDAYCTATTVVDVCVPVKQPSEEATRQPPEHTDGQQPLEVAQTVQIEHVVAEIVKLEPQPTITPISVDNDSKVVPEEKPAAAGLPVAAKKLPSTALGNNSSEQKIKPPPVTGEPQQHKVDKKTSYNNSRTSNQFSSSRENNYSRTDSQTSAGSGKISSKGSNKSGPSIILRAANAPEKKAYQQMQHVDSAPVNTNSNRDTSHYSSSGTSVTPQAELKKTQLNTSSTQNISKETINSAVVPNNNSSNVQNNSQVEVKKSHTVPAWGQAKKWSQLFNNGATSKDTASPTKDPVVQSNPVPATSPSEPVAKQASTPPNPEHMNRQLKSLGEQLKSISVDHKSLRPFLPRGLVNRGNMCYVHTTLQVLLSCPSVYNLFSSLNHFPILSKEPSATPLTDCMIQFTNEFSITEADWEANQKAIRKKKGGRDLAKGSPFQPDYVYSVLHKMHSSLTVRGKQEDAEEFLGSILDGLHEEMVEAKKAASPLEVDVDSTTAGEVLPPSSVAISDEADEWEEVGHKNKSTITRMVSSFAESHITEIFGGKMRSAVHHQGAKESATVQPFFTLPLDIQASDVTSVEEALCRLAIKEPLHGFTCSKTQTEVEAFKRITLSKLPSVLILHLKRFLFNQTGGSQKVSKEISYPLELEIPKELLAPTLIKGKNKTYRLTGVIYHHGKYAAGGHYTCDVYHSSCGGWIRLDDSLIKPITDEQVVKHYKERTPYLLFYQKSDNISCSR